MINVPLRILRRCQAVKVLTISFSPYYAPFGLHNSFSFSTNRQNHSDELMNYETYLRKHNQSLKKPHEKLRTEQQRITKEYLSSKRFSDVIQFLSRNVDMRLCNSDTATTVDKTLTAEYEFLPLEDKTQAAFALISFRQQRLFKLFRKEVQKILTEEGIQRVPIDQLIIYLYGQIITYKNLNFLKNVKIKRLPQGKVIEGVKQALFYQETKSNYRQEQAKIIRYIDLKIDSAENRLEHIQSSTRKRSILQTDIEAFLKVLGLDTDREIKVNGYDVDFVVTKKIGSKQQKLALEVNGSYHYTLPGKIKGREVLRNVIINQCLPLRIIHHQDYLLSKGYRNKLAYIQNVINAEDVNWECKHQGTDSGWHVTQTEGLL